MKIHRVRVFNIASLAGNHDIDFDYIAQNSNIFAITGKTGSGKSTLLNSISLALYGCVYKTTTSSGDYITLGEDVGEIDVIYSSGLKRYKASWRLRIRKKNGELLKKPQLNRTFFEYKNNEEIPTDISPEEILGLNFNQFCKTSILNQGEFSKFLNSKFSERKEILEKLYEGENLEGLNQALKNKLKHTNEKRDKIINLIDGIKETLQSELIPKKQLEEDKNIVSTMEEDLELFSSIQNNGRDIEGLHNTILENQIRLKKTSSFLTDLHSEYNLQIKKLDNLTNTHNEKTTHLEERKPFLISAIAKRQSLVSLSSRQNENNKKQDLFFKQIAQQEEKLTNLELNLSKQMTRKEKATTLYPFLKDINHDLFELNFNELLQLTSSNDQISKELLSTQKNIKTENIRLCDIQNEINELKTKLKLTMPLEESKTQEMIKQNTVLTKATILLQTYLDQHNQSDISLKKNRALIDDINIKITEFISKLEIKKLTLDDLYNKKKISELSETVKLLILESKKQNSCSICNQEIKDDHTFCKPPSESGSENIDEHLEMQEAKIYSIEKELISLKADLKSKEDQNDQFAKQIASYSNSYLLQIKEIQTILPTLVPDILEKNQTLINEYLIELNTKLDSNKSLKEKYQLIEGHIKTKQELLVEFNKNLERFNNELKLQNERKEKNDVSINDLAQKFDIFDKKIEEVKKINLYRIEFKKILSELELALNNKNHINNSLEDLKTRNSHLNQESIEIDNEIKALEKYIEENDIPEKPEQYLQKIEDEFKNSQLELSQLDKRIKELDISLAEYKSKKNNITEQIEQTVLLRDTHLQEFSVLLSKIFESKSMKEESCALQLINKLKEIKSENYNHEVFKVTLKQFLEVKENFQNTYKDKRDSFIRDENNYLLYLKNKSLIESHQDELNIHTTQLDKLSDLNVLIGKDEFRNYVLSIVENNLLIQTNEELKLLCQGRYYLTQTNKNNKMASEFLIIDNFRDAMARKVATLSGGETFLVSLAMAMALAELTRGNTQIDSLFIDEGFGTLDGDSINEVYELLQTIQLSGKQLGIISHVQNLTSRIPINIQLHKNQNGLSEIQILLN